MSLVQCSECKKEISSAAKSCPHCGKVSLAHQINKSAGNVVLIFIIIGIVGVFLLR